MSLAEPTKPKKNTIIKEINPHLVCKFSELIIPDSFLRLDSIERR
jgi:hypothetical protein